MIVIYPVKVRHSVLLEYLTVNMISLSALRAFLHGLVKNTTCRTLELKVHRVLINNIHLFHVHCRATVFMVLVQRHWHKSYGKIKHCKSACITTDNILHYSNLH